MPTKEPTHLVTVFSKLIMLGLELRKQRDLGPYMSLRSQLEKWINEADQDALETYSREKVNDAKFAVVAFLDEMILNSGWDQKAEWAKIPLQFVFFQERNAGTKFFENLSKLRTAIPSNIPVLEVYFFCLALGFEGKYKLYERERLREILHDVRRELVNAFDDARWLSPAEGKAPKELMEEVKQGLPVWVVGIASVSIVFVGYLILSALINYEGTTVINTLHGFLKSQSR